MPRLLVFHPEFDRASIYLGYWARLLADMARTIGYAVTDLPGPHANRANLENALPFASLVIFASHGMPGFIRGYDRGPAFDFTNDQLARNKAVYAMASLAGAELGPDLIRKRARLFAGWRISPHWPISPILDPANDAEAAPFAKYFLEIGRCFLFCDSAEAIRNTQQRVADQLIRSLNPMDARVMSENRDGFVVLD